MADFRLATWERGPFYIGLQAAWAARSGTSDVWSVYRETSGNIPIGFAPRQSLGLPTLGKPYPKASDYVVGKAGPTMSTTFPLTKTVMNDLASLFLQTSHDAVDDFIPYVTPDVTKYASISTELAQSIGDDSRGTNLIVGGTTFLLRNFNITIPQSAPGDTGGLVEASCDWIGTVSEISDVSIVETTPVVDDDAYLLSRDCDLLIGGVAADFISANINMSNNIAMHSDSGSLPLGAALGPLNVTGSVTVAGMTDSGETLSSHDTLLTEIEASTVSAIQFDFDWDTPGATVPHIGIYAAITSVTGPIDIGGMQAWTYNFELAWDGVADPFAPPLMIHGDTHTLAIFYAV